MPDNFILLDQPRRPWLEPEALKEKFFALSASVHPDHAHGLSESERATAHERYTALNAAYSCLRDPRSRLRHLLELELGAVSKDVQSIPSELMDLSLKIGRACREADSVVLEKNRATSPLLKVQLFERSQQRSDELQPLQRMVNDKREALLSELKQLDAAWLAGAADPIERAALLQRLERIYRLLGYFDRWLSQIQERIVHLAF